jgi:hypothetical protein
MFAALHFGTRQTSQAVENLAELPTAHSEKDLGVETEIPGDASGPAPHYCQSTRQETAVAAVDPAEYFVPVPHPNVAAGKAKPLVADIQADCWTVVLRTNPPLLNPVLEAVLGGRRRSRCCFGATWR